MKPLPPVNMFNLLVKMHDELQPLTEKINFNKENIQHFTIITPYRSIFELTGACILLIKHQQLTGVPILTRSILEAYVELSNTINLQEYTDILHAECLDHWIKYLKLDISSEILNGNVDILNGFIKNKEKLAMQGHKPLKISDKFDKASMGNEYKSIYSILCCDAHNNLNALLRRHVKQQTEDFKLTIYKETTINDCSMCLSLLLEYFCLASEKTHEFFNSPVQKDINSYRITNQ